MANWKADTIVSWFRAMTTPCQDASLLGVIFSSKRDCFGGVPWETQDCYRIMRHLPGCAARANNWSTEVATSPFTYCCKGVWNSMPHFSSSCLTERLAGQRVVWLMDPSLPSLLSNLVERSNDKEQAHMLCCDRVRFISRETKSKGQKEDYRKYKN